MSIQQAPEKTGAFFKAEFPPQRKVDNMSNQLSHELECKILRFIENWKITNNVYFWKIETFERRRYYENKYNGSINFNFDGKHYFCFYRVTCNFNRVFVKRSIFVDGIKKTIRELNKLIDNNSSLKKRKVLKW